MVHSWTATLHLGGPPRGLLHAAFPVCHINIFLALGWQMVLQLHLKHVSGPLLS